MTTFNAVYYQNCINWYEKDFIGLDVIALSNEPDPIQVGTLIGWTTICQSNQESPVISVNGKELIVLGHILPYSDELWNMLKPMNSKQAWVMFCAIFQLNEKRNRKHRLK